MNGPVFTEHGLMVESFAQAKDLKKGWLLWIGTGWATITRVKIPAEGSPVICCNDLDPHVSSNGTGYRVDYLQAVQYRRPWYASARGGTS